MKLCPYHKDGLGWDACSEGFKGCEIKKARGEKEMKRIELSVGGIVIEVEGESGNITSDLHESHPELTREMQDSNTQEEEWSDECERIDQYNSAIDGLESFILALACSGHYDLDFPPFAEAVETAVQAIGNNNS